MIVCQLLKFIAAQAVDAAIAHMRDAHLVARELNGHDMAGLEQALTQVPFEVGRPSCIIAHTVKGKGVSFMENKLLWHYRAPLGEDQTKALAELEHCQ